MAYVPAGQTGFVGGIGLLSVAVTSPRAPRGLVTPAVKESTLTGFPSASLRALRPVCQKSGCRAGKRQRCLTGDLQRNRADPLD